MNTAWPNTDQGFPATVRDTVMAEQISHNVVNQSESASGSPLVDVAAKQTISGSTFSVTEPQTTTAANLDTSTIADELVSQTDTSATNEHWSLGFAKNAADPSAGDVAIGLATDSSDLDATSASGEHVNGIHESINHIDALSEDRSLADASINSDTDNSRTDAAEKKDVTHHMRSNSVKKPATFVKVTATRNFLAKAVTPAPAAPKAGERANVTAINLQPALKPRLVAKSAGPSLRDIQKSRADGPNGPDASKVWNKNRPVPAPPPRQFTDEELKQQYGIHLATRLQTDESGKESKWADIDDEEDDWVPEQVVWMDGTKSSLTPQDAALPQKEEEVTTPQPVKPADGVKPTLANMKKPEVTTRTILKPGAASASQAKQNVVFGLSTGPDKPLLKAKNSTSAPPMKSPWAPVPKVETISPINPPAEPPAPLPQLAPQDARAYESQPQATPAREIAADTFDRSWREGEGVPRELFNSSNGRYEPAPEGRRHVIRSEVPGRKPAVLQRPSQNGIAPAEPSPAFQSRTSSQVDGSWSRRRGSSVSQGSIPAHRRMSTSKGSEVSEGNERRLSTVINHETRAPSQTAKPIVSQQSAWDQQMPPRPIVDAEPTTPAEDPVKAQERIMREKRELAKKRREDELALEVAAKEERLKLKLAELGGAGKSRKEREAEAAAAKKAAETPKEQLLVQPQPVKPVETPAATTPSANAVDLLPAVERSTEQSPPDNVLTLPSPIPSKFQSPGLSTEPSSKQTSRVHLSPSAGTRSPYQQSSSTYKAPSSAYSSPGDRKPQASFQRSPALDNNSNGTFKPWGPATQTSNVWGSAGIGNGTFENSIAPIPMSQQGASLPLPPGMNRPSTASRISPQAFKADPISPALQHQHASEQQHAYSPTGIESRPDSFGGQSRLNGISPAPGAGRPAHPPGPIGPPSRNQQQSLQRPDAIAAWQAAAERLPAQYAMAVDQKKAEVGASEAPKYTPTFNQTFKKTSVEQGRLGGPRKFEKVEHSIHDSHGSRVVSTHSPAPPNAQTQPSGPFTTVSPVQDHWKQSHNTVRIPDGSQNPAHGGASRHQAPSSIGPLGARQATAYPSPAQYPTTPLAPMVYSKDQSPPPPETESHPVNTGDVSHPHVKLPPPQAKVKLPPSFATSTSLQTGSVMLPHRSHHHAQFLPPGASMPIVTTDVWQARINGLFHRTSVQTETPPSPPKTPPKMQDPALAVAASSRLLMDYQSNLEHVGTTVSLPQPSQRSSTIRYIVDDSSDVVSRPMIDPIFHAEQSFGSMPKVRVPRNTTYDRSAVPMRRFNESRLGVRLVESQSVLEPPNLIYTVKEAYYLKIPNTKLRNLRVLVPGFEAPSSRYTKDKRDISGRSIQDRKLSGKLNKGRPNHNSNHTSESTVASATNESGKRHDSERKSARPSPATVTSPLSGKDVPPIKTTPNDSKRKPGFVKPPRSSPRRNAPVATSS